MAERGYRIREITCNIDSYDTRLQSDAFTREQTHTHTCGEAGNSSVCGAASARNEVINRNGRVFNNEEHDNSGARSSNFRDTILGIKANRRWDNGQFHFRGVAGVFQPKSLGWIDNYTVLLLCTAILADRRAYAKFSNDRYETRRG